MTYYIDKDSNREYKIDPTKNGKADGILETGIGNREKNKPYYIDNHNNKQYVIDKTKLGKVEEPLETGIGYRD